MKHLLRAFFLGLAAATALAGTVAAQTVPPPAENGVPLVVIQTIPGLFLVTGADAFAPLLPLAPPGVRAVLPEQIIPEIADVPMATVVFSYFGPRAVVLELLSPQLMIVERPLPILSTASQGPDSVTFGVRPAGSQVIAFFLREGYAYILDLATNNYAWIPFKSEDVERAP
ncbi:MAG: hypothetical protein HYX52_09570 [Chloroflexi bacterium]|nr:hypothetical protein [Chloroflexota bacterium]